MTTRPSTTCRRCGCSARSASPSTPRPGCWYYAAIGGERCPIVDTWWQTETGAIMITTLPGLIAAKSGSAPLPLPGVSAALVDESGAEIDQGSGLLVLTRPWPGMLRTLYDDPDRYVQTYFGRFGRRHLFRRRRRPARPGRLFLDHRAGRRRHQRVRPPAVHRRDRIGPRLAPRSRRGRGRRDRRRPDRPVGGGLRHPELRRRARTGPGDHVARARGPPDRQAGPGWAGSIRADDLPKTRSGKIMRRLLRDVAEGREPGDVTTLRDATVLTQLQQNATPDQPKEAT